MTFKNYFYVSIASWSHGISNWDLRDTLTLSDFALEKRYILSSKSECCQKSIGTLFRALIGKPRAQYNIGNQEGFTWVENYFRAKCNGWISDNFEIENLLLVAYPLHWHLKLRPAIRNMVRQCGSEYHNHPPPFPYGLNV